MNQRMKDRIKSDSIFDVTDINGKKIFRDGKLTLYGRKLAEEEEKKKKNG